MKPVVLLMTTGLAFGLAGCGDEPPETEAFCTSFGAGATYLWTACDAGCQLAAQANAHDGNLVTTATIVPQNGQTTYTTRLTATSAADIASGAVPGVFITQPSFANFVTMNTTMRTLKDGVEIEVLDADNEEISLSDNGTPAAGFLGMRTTQDFDALEFNVTVTWSNGQVPNYAVYEICADGGNV